MKAMALHKPMPIEQCPLLLEDVPDPMPAAGGVRVKVEACGLCHTDLHTIEGEISAPRLPVIPGHQIVGRIESKGKTTERFRVGDRVGVPWLYSTCGQCRFCKTGRENLCENARFTGLHADGGYARYMVVPADFAYPLPESLTAEQAAPLLCGGIIGFRALRLCGAERGGHLGLFGFGNSAHIAIQVARHWGCEVCVFTRSEDHARLARHLGAEWTGRAEDSPPAKLDAAIVFAPAGQLIPVALRHMDKGATLALAGIYMSPMPETPYELLYHERVVRSVANSTRQDAIDFLALAAEIPVRTEVRTFPLEKANEALLLMKRGEITGGGVLVI
ncbi:zinc-dependent alcohol dehydrogenase family protein [Candidatus Sumerlaeota bacterium]|nr:zinc-dependent alcohol dehydrogenase family protein [Candidatus Sumerlaeota bacterium]